MDISMLNIVIWIWKLTFQFWKLLFKFKKLIWSKNWYLNSKLLFSSLKITISIQKTLLTLNIDILILNILFELEIWYLNSEDLNLNLKKLFDLKVESWNSKLLFWILEINISIQKIINWVLKWTF
jgi:hypothetical protein